MRIALPKLRNGRPTVSLAVGISRHLRSRVAAPSANVRGANVSSWTVRLTLAYGAYRNGTLRLRAKRYVSGYGLWNGLTKLFAVQLLRVAVLGDSTHPSVQHSGAPKYTFLRKGVLLDQRTGPRHYHSQSVETTRGLMCGPLWSVQCACGCVV